jgi:hypothetical protein
VDGDLDDLILVNDDELWEEIVTLKQHRKNKK